MQELDVDQVAEMPPEVEEGEEGLKGNEVHSRAQAILRTCAQLMRERGAQHGNACLSEPGRLTSRLASDLIMAAIEIKLARWQEAARRGNFPCRDTLLDLINYIAFYCAQVDLANPEMGW